MDISAELAETASYGGFFALTVGGGPAGWHPVVQAYADGFADLIGVAAARYGTAELRVPASLIYLGHASRLWSPVLACAIGHGVIPDLTDLQRADGSTELRLPYPVGDAIVGTGHPSPDALYRVVVQNHMEPFAAGLRVKVAPGLLAGNIASALVGAAHALISVRPDLRQQVVGITRSLLSTGVLAGSGAIVGSGLRFRRRSCCLFYRTPAGSTCGDCPL